MRVPLPQASYWRGNLVRWPDVEVLEQSLHVSVLLVLLLLLEIGHLFSHGCLPLCVIMQSTLHGSCSFFNGFEPIVDAMKGHLFIVVPTARVGYLSSLR